jgi:cell division transport system permease protein
MVVFNASQLLHELGHSLTVQVYVQDGAGPADLAALEKKVRARPGVQAVKVLSREQDRARNRALLDKDLLDGLDEGAVPGQPVLEVEVAADLAGRSDVDELAAWAKSLQGVDRVEDVAFGAEKLRLLFAVVEIARTIGVVLSVVLLASAMFFVLSTIRLGVFARRDEIEILGLVGATPMFVRIPFLVEGVLQGLCGACVALLLLTGLHLELRGLVRDVYMLNVGWSLLPPGMIAWLFCGGPVVGFVASAISVGRYLKA